MTAKKTATPNLDKPKFVVIDGKLYCQTTEGELVLPLTIKTKLIRKIRDAEVDQFDQFLMILDGLGDKATVAKIDELDFMDTAEIVAKFFSEFEQIQKARMDLLGGQPTS